MTENHEDGLLDPLTQRELEILGFLAEGLADHEIGEKLFLSVGTVKWHIKNIYSKFGIHKRTAVIARARVLGLLGSSTLGQTLALPPRHNLPYQTTSFVGRETDTSSILTMLADPNCRLLTLVGVGGIGKTRLAIQCGGQLVDTFSDGVFYINFDSVSASFLPSAIAEALNFRTAGKEDLRNQLIRLLRHQKRLLILDSFEHLITEAAFVVQMLHAAPNLKIIITSREVLNLSEEWIYPVDGLSVPGNQDSDQLEAFGAARLFIDRALRVRNDFSLTTERQWIARICQMVGGMPLAIELLSTWLNVLNCQAVVTELERQRDVIEADRRDLPQRQKSMRAVFAQSWDLLNSDEQAIMMKVSVFRGGFTREAAEFVAGASLHKLVALVNKSLISANKEGRHGLHLLLRHFLETKRLELDDLDSQTRALHSQYYAQALTESDLIKRDADNVWTGMVYAIDHRRLSDLAGFIQGLWQHFEARGWYLVEPGVFKIYQDAIAVLESSISTRENGLGSTTLRIAYESLANLYYTAQRYTEARSAYQSALAYSESADHITQARLYRKIAGVFSAQRIELNATLEAYTTAENILDSRRQEDNPHWWQEWIQLQLDAAWTHYTLTDIPKMIEILGKTEQPVQTYGTPSQRSTLYFNRSLLDYRRHMFYDLPEETLHNSQMALEALSQTDNQPQIAWIEFNLGFTHLWRDELDMAEKYFLQALERARKVGDINGAQPTGLTYIPLIYRRRQQIDEAERWAKQGLQSATDASNPVYIATSLGNLAWVHYRRGEYQQARELCEKAVDLWTNNSVPGPMQFMARIPLLAILLDAGELERAVQQARVLCDPRQKILHAPLPIILREAIQTWDAGDQVSTSQLLRTFCEQCPPYGYL